LPARKCRRKQDDPKNREGRFRCRLLLGITGRLRKIPGVVNTTVANMGGTLKNPTYEDVCTDTTGHAETVLRRIDPAKVTYAQLLKSLLGQSC